MLAAAFLIELLHPLKGNGYQWWSGAGSDLSEVMLLVGLVAWYRHHNCHQHRCWRLGRFQHGHFVLCHKHHPKVPDDGRVSQAHVRDVKETP